MHLLGSFRKINGTHRLIQHRCHRHFAFILCRRDQGFILELGQGFMLVGREYRLEIGTKERFVDLLFFHMNLNRYVVVEVKVTEFKEEHLGQLGLYVSAVNHLLKKSNHEPTIGLLVCKTKDNTMVKWALESSQQPIGVSEYRISEILPNEIVSDLPSVADIESAVGGAK
jgi:hypothetical protein